MSLICSQGSEFYVMGLGAMLGVFLAAMLFVPLLYPLKLTSVNEVCFFFFFIQEDNIDIVTTNILYINGN